MEKKKPNSIYDPIYISKRENISIEEAVLYIDNMKKNKATSLKGFIARHGEELGNKKFKEFQESSKHTLKKYIIKYGEILGKEKWDNYLLTKDSTSYNWALKKNNGNIELAKKLHEKRLSDLSFEFNDDYFINKYGIDNYLLEKEKFLKSRDTSSYNWALTKADGDYKKADEIYFKRNESKAVMFGKASKESLLLFNPLIEWLLNNNFDEKDILCGIKNSYELCIFDKNDRIRYYYDFCIKSLNLIIEFNGKVFHPNYEKYDIEYLNNTWKHPFNKNITALDMINKDKNKIRNAINAGYDIHIIWHSDEDKLEYVKKIIKNKINNNENKKNNNINS